MKGKLLLSSRPLRFILAFHSITGHLIQSLCLSPVKSISHKCVTKKATEQYVPAVLSVSLHGVVLTIQFGDKILKCDHSNESY